MPHIGWIIWFGAGSLAAFSLVYFFFDPRPRNKRNEGETPQKRRHFNITFARLFGLITVAVLAAALAQSAVKLELATAAFTLLGTIAGYLAGANPTTAPAAAPPPVGQPASTSGPEPEMVL